MKEAGYRSLALAVIQMAVEDYKFLTSDEGEYCETDDCNREEIMDFLNDDWCECLLGDMALSGKAIINALT